VHPELNALSDYMSGEEVLGEGAWCGGSMTLREGARTMATENGHSNGRPPIAGLTDEDVNTVLYVALFPNALVSMHPDYVMLHTLWPRAADRTDVICEWYFEPATIAREGFDPSDAVGFWDTVNRQDWYVCELTQKGVRTRGYSAGRYSAEEVDVHAFDLMVANRYMEALREAGAVPA
jgi:Rieske 2Fe-2S family protein